LFQGLETGAGGFSRPWKLSRKPVPSLGESRPVFSESRKNLREKFRALEDLHHQGTKAPSGVNNEIRKTGTEDCSFPAFLLSSFKNHLASSQPF
jgi:hypothetical protein